MTARNKSTAVFILGLIALFATVCSRAKADPNDPFDRSHRAKPRLTSDSLDLAKKIDFKAKVEPEQASPGQLVRLTITGEPIKGHHTYPLTRRTPQQTALMLSKLKLEENP